MESEIYNIGRTEEVVGGGTMKKWLMFSLTVVFVAFALVLMLHDIIDMPRMTQSICDAQLGRCLK